MSNVALAATVTDTQGTVTNVAFYQGATLLANVTSAPYLYTWANVPAGSYSVTAQATDNNGATATSAAASINVTNPSVVPFSGSYTQNFDGLGVSGTSLTALAEWQVYSLSGSHDTFSYAASTIDSADFLPWSTPAAINVGTGSNSLTPEPTLTVQNFTSTNQAGVKSAGGYNFGASYAPYSNTDRALGSSPTGTAATELQLSLINTSGHPISALNLGYDIRRFTVTVDNNGAPTTDPWYGLEEQCPQPDPGGHFQPPANRASIPGKRSLGAEYRGRHPCSGHAGDPGQCLDQWHDLAHSLGGRQCRIALA